MPFGSGRVIRHLTSSVRNLNRALIIPALILDGPLRSFQSLQRHAPNSGLSSLFPRREEGGSLRGPVGRSHMAVCVGVTINPQALGVQERLLISHIPP